MAIQGFCPPPSPPSPPSPSHSPYYQLLERGSARLGRFNKYIIFFKCCALQVIEEKDYPPSANAGEDVVVYLPNNQVVLHGNQSSDDHGIVSWEWTLNEGTVEFLFNGCAASTKRSLLRIAFCVVVVVVPFRQNCYQSS